MRNLLHNIVRLPSNIITMLITAYQHTLSLDHGPLRHLYPYGFCRHSPTCSENMKFQVQKRGAVIGVLLGLKQIAMCGPWKKPSPQKVMETTYR